jgi:hypothetical protein
LRILTYKLSRVAFGALFITPLVLLASSTISAQDAKPDFTGATGCSCYIQTTSDNLGNTNGYLVRLDIQYRDNLKPRWNHRMRMYRAEDRKKAGQFCLSMYKQYFKEEQKQYEALQKQTQRQATWKQNHQASIKSSLAPTL